MERATGKRDEFNAVMSDTLKAYWSGEIMVEETDTVHRAARKQLRKWKSELRDSRGPLRQKAVKSIKSPGGLQPAGAG